MILWSDDAPKSKSDVDRLVLNVNVFTHLVLVFVRDGPFNFKGGGCYSDSQCCWKKYSDFGGEKKNWFRVFVI